MASSLRRISLQNFAVGEWFSILKKCIQSAGLKSRLMQSQDFKLTAKCYSLLYKKYRTTLAIGILYNLSNE